MTIIAESQILYLRRKVNKKKSPINGLWNKPAKEKHKVLEPDL